MLSVTGEADLFSTAKFVIKECLIEARVFSDKSMFLVAEPTNGRQLHCVFQLCKSDRDERACQACWNWGSVFFAQEAMRRET